MNLEPRVAARLLAAAYMRTLGGPGSGNFGHAGRPGEVGGSAPSATAALSVQVAIVRERGLLNSWLYADQDRYFEQLGYTKDEAIAFRERLERHTRDASMEAADKDIEVNWNSDSRFGQYLSDRAAAEMMLIRAHQEGADERYAREVESVKAELKQDERLGVSLKYPDETDAEYVDRLTLDARRVRDAAKDPIFYRRGGIGKTVLSTTTNPGGAQTGWMGGSTGATLKPTHRWRLSELMKEGYVPIAGMSALYGYVGEGEVLFLKTRKKQQRSLGGPGSGNFGHAGRPGQVGGSAPADGGEPNEETRVKLERALYVDASEANGIANQEGREPYRDLSEFSTNERGKIKEKVVDDLYKAQSFKDDLILSKKDIQDRLDLWATTSGDHNFDSVLAQHSIKTEFGLDGAVVEHMADISKDLNDPSPYLKQQIELDRKFSRTEYDNTQRWLKEKGIDEVTVYRGMGFPKGSLKAGTVAEVTMQPASSWTTSLDTATDFAAASEMKGVRNVEPYVISARVPARRVLSTAVTGRGCLTEAEVLLLGGKIRVRVER